MRLRANTNGADQGDARVRASILRTEKKLSLGVEHT